MTTTQYDSTILFTALGTCDHFDLLSPGQTGSIPSIEVGVGGEGAGDGTIDGAGVAGSAAVATVDGTPVSGVVVLLGGEAIVLAGSGGHGAFAGGGGRASISLTCPAPASATFAITSGNSSITVLTNTITANKGTNASSNTPGTGGAEPTVPSFFDDWSPSQNPGTDGTAAIVSAGGTGGIGGEYHRIPSTPTPLYVAGDDIQITINGDATEILNVTSNKIIYRYGFFEGDYTDFPENNPESAAERSGAIGDSEFGGGGAAGQTFGHDGFAVDAGTPAGGTDFGGKQGGDGGDIDHHNGQDGLTPGDAGGGAGPFLGAVGGAGQTGFAIVVYSTVAVPPTITSAASFNVTEGNTAVGTVTATGDATIAFTLGSGLDASKFSLNSSSGVLAFQAAPDFEVPSSYLGMNIYYVPVVATNGAGSATQTIVVKVINNAGDDPAANTEEVPFSHPALIPQADPANFVYNLQRESLL